MLCNMTAECRECTMPCQLCCGSRPMHSLPLPETCSSEEAHGSEAKSIAELQAQMQERQQTRRVQRSQALLSSGGAGLRTEMCPQLAPALRRQEAKQRAGLQSRQSPSMGPLLTPLGLSSLRLPSGVPWKTPRMRCASFDSSTCCTASPEEYCTVVGLS